jgi:predicted 2-oxoglutarate/Fe(II)-dependent dioxygenase YbiX
MNKNWKEQRLPDNQIFLLDNVISDDLCNEVIHIINTSKTKKERHGPGSNVHGEICFPHETECKEIDDKIFNVVSTIIQDNFYNLGTPIKGDSGYQLRKIEGATRRHADGVLPKTPTQHQEYVKVGSVLRVMSLIIALNSDYEGGELCFPEQNIMVKLKKGQALAFPPFWTHPHYTNDLLNNTVRYTINTWLTE